METPIENNTCNKNNRNARRPEKNNDFQTPRSTNILINAKSFFKQKLDQAETAITKLYWGIWDAKLVIVVSEL